MDPVKTSQIPTDYRLWRRITTVLFVISLFVPYIRIKGEWVSVAERSLEGRGSSAAFEDAMFFLVGCVLLGWLVQFQFGYRRAKRRERDEPPA